MTKTEYIAYFENLAIQSKVLNHDPLPANKKQSFFYISDPYTTTSLDNALRNRVQYPVMLLDAPSGVLDNNEGANYTNTLQGQFRIVGKTDKDNIDQVQDACFKFGFDILTRMRHDSRLHQIMPNKPISFQIEDVPYEPIGPISLVHYGYVFSFRFICPFSFSVTSASWRDI